MGWGLIDPPLASIVPAGLRHSPLPQLCAKSHASVDRSR